MGMYDELQGLGQVKCFNCNLDYFKIGDTVPFRNTYNSNQILILSLEINVCDCDCFEWRNSSIALVKNNIYTKYINISNLSTTDNALYKDSTVIDSDGRIVNIKSTMDLFNFIKEKRILKKTT